MCRIAAPYKLVNRMFHPNDSIVDVGGIKVGGDNPIVMIGGPCSVEGKEEIIKLQRQLKKLGEVC